MLMDGQAGGEWMTPEYEPHAFKRMRMVQNNSSRCFRSLDVFTLDEFILYVCNAAYDGHGGAVGAVLRCAGGKTGGAAEHMMLMLRALM